MAAEERYCPEHAICNEKICRLQDEINSINNTVQHFESRINTIDRTLGDRLLVLETTTKLGNELVNNNIEKLAKKIDKLVEENDKNKDKIYEKKEIRQYEWVKWFVMYVLGIIITYIAVRLGLK